MGSKSSKKVFITNDEVKPMLKNENDIEKLISFSNMNNNSTKEFYRITVEKNDNIHNYENSIVGNGLLKIGNFDLKIAESDIPEFSKFLSKLNCKITYFTLYSDLSDLNQYKSFLDVLQIKEVKKIYFTGSKNENTFFIFLEKNIKILNNFNFEFKLTTKEDPMSYDSDGNLNYSLSRFSFGNDINKIFKKLLSTLRFNFITNINMSFSDYTNIDITTMFTSLDFEQKISVYLSFYSINNISFIPFLQKRVHNLKSLRIFVNKGVPYDFTMLKNMFKCAQLNETEIVTIRYYEDGLREKRRKLHNLVYSNKKEITKGDIKFLGCYSK